MAVISITGDKALDRKLAQFEPKVQKKIERKAVRKAAKPVYETARARIQVYSGTDPRIVPGAARKTIKIRALKRSRKNKNTVGVQVITDPKLLEAIGLFNPHWLEFGTEDTRKFPFMRPAHDENKSTVAGIFQSEVRAIIAETAREA